jgi:histidine kinase
VEEGQSALDEELLDAFSGSLTIAMLVALGVGGLAALVVATLVARRLVSPLQRMRGAVRLMADGRHDERVPVPKDLELAELATDVNALGRALEETEARRAQLVSDLAHELRTPITSIDGFLEGLEDGVFEPDAETLGAMRAEARRLQRLATDLGVLSRAAEQAFDLAPTDLDLGEVAQEAGRGLAAAFSRAGVLFDPGEPVPLPVRADRDRIAQIFTNLIRNGLQHTPEGGSVRLTTSTVDGTAQVIVSDTGAGIASADLARVFDRFYRSGDEPSSGAGVGLTIARAIARAHGGDVTAASSGADAGSTFTVTIPLRD